MAHSPNSTGRTLIILVLAAIAFFAVVSGLIAVATVDDCGSRDAPKEWRIFPPGWECTSPFR